MMFNTLKTDEEIHHWQITLTLTLSVTSNLIGISTQI